jgi:methylenetetrahydrofolate--tRNA-(uracil-5-)-methyltransferase
MEKKIIIVGGGLAGVEAAYQISKRGIRVDLYEMRPQIMTEAHTTGFLGEMVCSNSLGSFSISSSSGLLKKELEMLDSFFLKVAKKNRVPAGNSFAVDRIKLAEHITYELKSMPNVNLINEEIKKFPRADIPVIIATGPLTSQNFSESLTKITMRKNLFFYDATSPIINAESIDYNKVFHASRYNKGEADFINIPLNEEQYSNFVNDLINAEKAEIKDCEKNLFFEACLPVEEIAQRGEKSLSFGPMKPIGLQLIGFQTRLKWGEQKRVLRKLPGLTNATFERYGRMHRNTYINAPLLIDKFYQSKLRENLFFAGQICGVEGYVESINSGLIAGIFASKKILDKPLYSLPKQTATGALINYISQANWKDFKPTKFTFGLLPDIRVKKANKKLKKELKAKIAVESLDKWIKKADI